MADMNKKERANIYYGLWIEDCDWCEEHFRKCALNYYNKKKKKKKTYIESCPESGTI